jgi:amino acid transporter
MYGTGHNFSDKAGVFAGELINLFTKSIGNWAYPIIATAALTTMFSTTLTCFDAYSRSMVPALNLSFPKLNIKGEKKERKWWFLMMFILLIGSLIILRNFVKNMTQMVDFATTLSFVLAPVLA